MTAYVFRVTWTDPRLVETDITEKITRVGSLSWAVADASELFAFTAPDLEFEASNWDGFFTSQVAAYTGMTTSADLFMVEVVRDGVRKFKGYVLPASLSFDRKKKSARFTALGPHALLDRKSAEEVSRPIANWKLSRDVGAPPYHIYIPDLTAEIYPGDELRVAGYTTTDPDSGATIAKTETTPRCTVTEVRLSDLGTDLELEVVGLPSDATFSVGSEVELISKYYRNKTIDLLATELFSRCGDNKGRIADYDIRYSGIVAEEPFLSSFVVDNASKDIRQHGSFVGLTFGTNNDGDDRLRLVTGAYDQAGDTNILETGTLTSGFSNTAYPGPTADEHGGYFDKSEIDYTASQPFHFETGGTPLQYFRYKDFHTIDEDAPGTMTDVHSVRISCFAPLKHTHSGTTIVMYEMRFVQNVNDVAYPEAGDTPDMDNGGGNWTLTLYRYTTTTSGAGSYGKVWTYDATFTPYTIDSGTQTGGQSGFFFQFSLTSTQYYPSGYEGTLFACYWAGIGKNPITLIERTPKLKAIRVASGAHSITATNVETLDSNCRGAKCIVATQSDPGYAVLYTLQGEPTSHFTNADYLCVWYFSDFSNYGIMHTLTLDGYVPRMSTLRWNLRSGTDSRVAFLYSSVARGSGIEVVSTGAYAGTDYTHPVENGFAFESRAMVDTYGTVDFGLEYWAYMPDTVIYFPRNELLLSPWHVSVGSDYAQTSYLWVGRYASTTKTHWFIYSTEHPGVINYADFTDMSVGEALRQLAFVVNASVWVDTDEAGRLVGRLVSQDKIGIANKATKRLSNVDGTAPAGAMQDLILDLVDTRSWNKQYPQVTVTGAGSVTATAGSLDYKQQGLSVSCKFIETMSYASAIANNLLAYYGPAKSPVQAPSISANGTTGATFYEYVVVFYNPSGQLASVSRAGYASNGNAVLSPTNYNAVAFHFPVGATYGWLAYAYRTKNGKDSTDVGKIKQAIPFSSGGQGTSNDYGNNTTYFDAGKAPPASLKPGRKAIDAVVSDDGTDYKPRDLVMCHDMNGELEGGDVPTWWVESVEQELSEPVIRLGLVRVNV